MGNQNLEEYGKKRKFDRTTEPKPAIKRGGGPLAFVVQKHHASHLHYDFRLELDGVLKSWAIPKGPSLNPKDKRLAMRVEDHPLDYGNFEGIIPEGNYGAGTVMVWDKGTYHPPGISTRAEAERAIRQGLERGHLTFILEGKKLKGEFALVRLKRAGENAWLLIKADDAHASEKKVEELDRSVLSKRTLEQIKSHAAKIIDLKDAPKASMPHDIKPMLATLVDEPFDRDNWIFEIKWDGYRAIAEITGKSVNLYSRNLLSFNQRFSPVTEALKSLQHEAVLDGEVVAVDERGKSQFQLLQNYQRTGKGNLVYYVFDLLYLDGHDLRKWPLLRRKKTLKEILVGIPFVKFSEHIEKRGTEFFKLAERQDLEGIMAKNGGSAYHTGARTRDWLKIKTHLEQEAVIGGFTEPRGSRKHLGALVLGVYKEGKLNYIGHSAGRLNQKTLADIRQKLNPLIRKNSPFIHSPKTNAPVHWVEPKLLAEVAFHGWTADGSMRQPVVLGLREDKPAREAAAEKPQPTAQILASGKTNGKIK